MRRLREQVGWWWIEQSAALRRRVCALIGHTKPAKRSADGVSWLSVHDLDRKEIRHHRKDVTIAWTECSRCHLTLSESETINGETTVTLPGPKAQVQWSVQSDPARW